MHPFLKEGFGIEISKTAHTISNGFHPLMPICTVCGGSGIQRVSSQRFRTCLACLGTGVISAAVQSAPLNQLATATVAANRVGCLPHSRG